MQTTLMAQLLFQMTPLMKLGLQRREEMDRIWNGFVRRDLKLGKFVKMSAVVERLSVLQLGKILEN